MIGPKKMTEQWTVRSSEHEAAEELNQRVFVLRISGFDLLEWRARRFGYGPDMFELSIEYQTGRGAAND